MSMIAMQNTIARLCVDLNFRRAFLRSPDETLSGLELTSDEAEGIKALDMEAVVDYAASLVTKRIGLFGKWLENPLILLERHLGRHESSHILMHYGVEKVRDNEELGGEWVRGEFARLCDHLRDLIRRKVIDIPGFEDLLDYEALKFLMTMDHEISRIAREFSEAAANATVDFTDESAGELKPLLGGHAFVRSFEYNVFDYLEHLDDGNLDADLKPEPISVLFYKNANQIRVETNLINPPLKDLLEMCDGQTPVTRMLSLLVAKYGESTDSTEDEVAADCMEVLEQLHAAGAITLAPAAA